MLARDLSSTIGASVSATPAGIDNALSTLRRGASLAALRELDHTQGSGDERPGAIHFPTLRARSRLLLALAQERYSRGDGSGGRAYLDENTTLLAKSVRFYHASSSFWSWMGTAHSGAAELVRLLDQSQADDYHKRALVAYESAAHLAPHELHPAKSALEAAEALHDQFRVQHWAQECLRINAQLRLDPLEQLPAPEVARLQQLVKP
jgi:hypothetical protein